MSGQPRKNSLASRECHFVPISPYSLKVSVCRVQYIDPLWKLLKLPTWSLPQVPSVSGQPRILMSPPIPSKRMLMSPCTSKALFAKSLTHTPACSKFWAKQNLLPAVFVCNVPTFAPSQGSLASALSPASSPNKPLKLFGGFSTGDPAMILRASESKVRFYEVELKIREHIGILLYLSPGFLWL